jgi:hypothetical protein
LVKLIGTYTLPAAAPPWEVSTFTFSPDEAQLSAAGVGGAAGEEVAGGGAGALDVAAALGDAAGLGGELVVLELHAAASNAVLSSVILSRAVMPSTRPCHRGTDGLMMVSSLSVRRLSVRQARRLL